jgi:hypothetical protein
MDARNRRLIVAPNDMTDIRIKKAVLVIGGLCLLSALGSQLFTKLAVSAGRTACLSNLQQVSFCAILYSQDYDETLPQAHEMARLSSPSTGVGWAGKLLPYTKTSAIFRCPNDREVSTGARQKISYGWNSNISLSADLSNVADPNMSIMFFEIRGGSAETTNPRETDSPAGNGLANYLFPRSVQYATGWNGLANRNGLPPRHGEGSTYTTLDGETHWLPLPAVSVGFSARNRTDDAKSSGCSLPGSTTKNQPCAAGTAAPRHLITFSVN